MLLLMMRRRREDYRRAEASELFKSDFARPRHSSNMSETETTTLWYSSGKVKDFRRISYLKLLIYLEYRIHF